MKELEELKTKAELAEALKVSQRTIDTYVIEGMPQFSKKPIRFLESECREWLKTRR